MTTPKMANKAEITTRILEVGSQYRCTKLPIDNVVFPKWDDNGIFGMMLRQCVSTKEFPEGHIYDEAQFQLVLRVLDGHLLMSDRPDCYCWNKSKVEKENSKGNIRPIGVNSANGLLNLMNVLQNITDQKERNLLADMFVSWNKDLMLIHLSAEERVCIIVKQDMLDSGITYCVNSYDDPDENGDAPATPIYVGDILIVESNGVYRVGREEADITYRIGEQISE